MNRPDLLREAGGSPGHATEDNRMRVIVIEPRTKDVREAESDGSLQSLMKLVEGDIEIATQLEGGDLLYVNEEGIYPFEDYFDVGAHQAFAGPGVIIGAEDRVRSEARRVGEGWVGRCRARG